MRPTAEQEEWVAMEVPAHGEISYSMGEYKKLVASTPKPQEPMIRVLGQGKKLTQSLMGQLNAAADQFLISTISPQESLGVVEFWQQSAHRRKYFVYSAAQHGVIYPIEVKEQAPFKHENVLHVGPGMFADLGDSVLIELMKSDGEQSLLKAWRNLRSVLDASHQRPNKGVAKPARPKLTLDNDPAHARRAHLLALGWPTSQAVGKRAGSKSRTPGQWAKDKRDAGQLMGVWSPINRTFLHPDFQFEQDGRIRPEVQRLLAEMAKNPSWAAGNDTSGWRRAYWLYQPMKSLSKLALAYAEASEAGSNAPLHGTPEEAIAYLDKWQGLSGAVPNQGRTPAEVFAENPEMVIALAKKEASQSGQESSIGAI